VRQLRAAFILNISKSSNSSAPSFGFLNRLEKHLIHFGRQAMTPLLSFSRWAWGSSKAARKIATFLAIIPGSQLGLEPNQPRDIANKALAGLADTLPLEKLLENSKKLKI
jgi:hypothetical protein